MKREEMRGWFRRAAKASRGLLFLAPHPLLLTFFLAGCGFHAAGNRPLPELLKQVRIDVIAPYRVSEPTVEAALRERLLRRGAEVVEKPRDDVTTIRLTDLKATREVLSVGADGKALEYDLILRANYEVRRGTLVLIPTDLIEVRRDYSFSADQVLSKEQEAERLRDFLEEEMAELLLLRIEAAAKQVAPPKPVLDVVPLDPTAVPLPPSE